MWNWDNKIFNVNGKGHEELTKALELALGNDKIVAFEFNKDKGLILFDFEQGDKSRQTKFPVAIHAKPLASILIFWLDSDQAKTVSLDGWDADAEHDGSNELGWRLYTEDWGNINNYTSVLAFKPAYLWYGK